MPHDIIDLRFFVTLTESGSLAEAARRLDVSPSAVSQRLQQLEARLGMQLAHRSTRRFSLTEEGELFHGGAVALLADMDALVDTVRERSGEVAGSLAAGKLVRLLPDWSLPDADVVALVASRAGLSARVKLFLAFLQARFQPLPPWRG